MVRLVNEPAWERFIGKSRLQTVEDGQRYLQSGPIDMYQRLGFGLYRVSLRASGEVIGLCGLIRRPALEDVDLGFAFLEEFGGQGYAIESAAAVVAHARREFGLTRLVAIVSDGNVRSEKLLAKLGFRFERRVRLSPDKPELQLFAREEP